LKLQLILSFVLVNVTGCSVLMILHISIVLLIGCRSATGVCTWLKIVHDSDLETLLSCSITTNGASYTSYVLKWWNLIIEKKKFFDQLIGKVLPSRDRECWRETEQ